MKSDDTRTPAPSNRRHEWALRMAVMAAAVLLVALLAELAIRIGIAAGWERVRDPRHYAGWCDDEDQWKLRYLWMEGTREALEVSGFSHDPLFGWAGPKPQADEPLAAPVLLYGDSFMRGVPPLAEEERIPALVDRLLPQREALDYSAPGYGLDQIYLRFRETYSLYERPVVVLGVMTLDLDRSLFSVRDAPKPYFELESGELQLRGVPVPEDRAAWHREHPPDLRSYLLSFLLRRLRTRGHSHETEIPYRREEKKVLNRALLEAFAREVERHHLRHLVIVFYPNWELGIDGWREAFLLDELERLNLDYLDTKELFLGNGGAEVLYLPPPNGHPNLRANVLVAEHVAEGADPLSEKMEESPPEPRLMDEEVSDAEPPR